MDSDSQTEKMYRDLYLHHEATIDIIEEVPGAPKGPIKDRVRWLVDRLTQAIRERDDALHNLRVRTQEHRDVVDHARGLSKQLANAQAAIERQEAENGRQAAALAEARRRLVEVANERDVMGEERDAASGRASRLILVWLQETLGIGASDLSTASTVLRAQKTLLDDSQADIHAALKAIREAGVCEGETLSEAVQALIASRPADKYVDRALAQLDAAGFDVMNKGLGALEDALIKMSKLERDAERLRGELQGVVAESTTLLDGHRREREEIEAMVSGYTTVSGTLVHRLADALQACRGMPLETIDVIIDPGHVENAQARRLTQEHVERSEERYKAACEAHDEVRRLKLAVVTLGRCAVELAGGDPRRV